MIDMLTISIPFREYSEDNRRIVFLSDDSSHGMADLDVVSKLGMIPMQGLQIPNPDGEGSTFCDLKHPYESIPSSLGSLAFKIFHKGSNCWPYVQIKASPAKLIQGHNVYGSEDFELGVMALLYTFMLAYPKMKHLINLDAAYFADLDCTYSSRCENEAQATQVINFLGSLSYGQTRNAEKYPTTVYFGKKDSPHRRMKAYLKHPELFKYTSKLRRSNVNGRNDSRIYACEKQLSFASGLVRFESTVKKRWLEERSVPTGIFAFVKYAKMYEKENGEPYSRFIWRETWAPIFKTFEGQGMQIYKDEELYDALIERFKKTSPTTGKTSISAAQSAFRTYRAIKSDGWMEAKRTISSSTLSRHVCMITKCGLSRAYLQNLDKPEINIVPLIRFTEIDFGLQRPDSYIEPQIPELVSLIAA